MRKFNVGDRVSVAKHSYILSANQRSGIVTERKTRYDYVVLLDNYGDTLRFQAFQLTKIDETPERLSEAEAQIAALEAEVAALKGIVSEAAFERSLETPTKPLFSQAHRKKTPNQRRADVIQRAKMFVADLEKRAESDDRNGDGNWLFNGRTTKLTFHVNADKGVVTALAHGRHGGKLYDKAFAKCHPNDVFNADIGKAIAAGKLYGVDISKEFLDAPNPTEVVVGMRVNVRGNLSTYEDVVAEGSSLRHSVVNIRKDPKRLRGIIEDSDVVYS